MKRHLSRQQETWVVVLLALVSVLLYASWGAAILKSQQQANTQQGAPLSIDR